MYLQFFDEMLGPFRLGYMFSESPGTFVAFISFSIVALLFLVTQETIYFR